MADDSKKSESEVKSETEESTAAEAQKSSPAKESGGDGGWGGWGFSLSYLSDLQKAAAEAAEEISRNVCAFALKRIVYFRLFSSKSYISICFCLIYCLYLKYGQWF